MQPPILLLMPGLRIFLPYNTLQDLMNFRWLYNLWRPLLASAEGVILLLGLAMALLGLAALLSSAFWWPDKAHLLVAITATSSLFGRAAGMSFGYASGFGHGVVVPLVIYVETVFVLIFYPLFVFSWHSLLVIRSLRSFMEHINHAAASHHGTIQKYGLLGLIAFVWLPFWLTGPVVGSAIGYLLGLKPWTNLAVVLAGTYLAIASWAILLRELNNYAAAYSSLAPMILVGVVVLAVVAMTLLDRRRRRRSGR
ncbi:MAG: small multi-drug export protein [Pseudomonadota bacterium]|nr:small multi-drug export protein [Pseudomonadota bacterium]